MNKNFLRTIVMKEAVAKQQRHLLATFVTLATTMAFIPVVPKGNVYSSALAPSRIAEIGLLGLAGFTVTLAILHRRCSLNVSSNALFLVLLYPAWALLSCLWTVDTFLSFSKSIELVMLTYIAIALVIYIRDTAQNYTEAVTTILANALLLAVLIALIANIAIWGTPLHFSQALAWSGRPGRLLFGYMYPLQTAEILGLATILMVISHKHVALKLVMAAALYMLMVLCNPRALMVIVPFTIGAYLYQRSNAQARFVIAAGALCCLAILVSYVAFGDVISGLPPDVWTLNGRLPLWSKVAESVTEHPILGVGFFASRHFLLGDFLFGGHAHNSYLETILTTGAIGFCILLTFLLYSVKITTNTGSSLLLTILIFNLLYGLVNPVMLVPGVPTFLVIFALLAAVEQQAAKSDQSKPDVFGKIGLAC